MTTLMTMIRNDAIEVGCDAKCRSLISVEIERDTQKEKDRHGGREGERKTEEGVQEGGKGIEKERREKEEIE